MWREYVCVDGVRVCRVDGCGVYGLEVVEAVRMWRLSGFGECTGCEGEKVVRVWRVYGCGGCTGLEGIEVVLM